MTGVVNIPTMNITLDVAADETCCMPIQIAPNIIGLKTPKDLYIDPGVIREVDTMVKLVEIPEYVQIHDMRTGFSSLATEVSVLPDSGVSLFGKSGIEILSPSIIMPSDKSIVIEVRNRSNEEYRAPKGTVLALLRTALVPKVQIDIK